MSTSHDMSLRPFLDHMFRQQSDHAAVQTAFQVVLAADAFVRASAPLPVFVWRECQGQWFACAEGVRLRVRRSESRGDWRAIVHWDEQITIAAGPSPFWARDAGERAACDALIARRVAARREGVAYALAAGKWASMAQMRLS